MIFPKTTESFPLLDVGSTFRGDIPENCKRFAFVGDGYKSMPAEQNGHFEIQSARQVAGPMRAALDMAVRIDHVIGATQVLKSIIGDAFIIYAMEHWLLPMLVLFEDEGKADLYCANRLMDTIRAHPYISKLLMESKKENRHNIQGTWIKTLQNQLLVAGLNDGNVSSLSWPVIWISEAWQHRIDGLLKKAFKRADRYADTCKILNESQAGFAGEDLHNAVKAAHPVPLEWRCPKCDGWQTWEWHHWSYKRPADFAPRQQKLLTLASIGGESAIITDQPKSLSYAGMKWADNDSGLKTIEQRSASAYWECIWCGHRISDTPRERKELCETYRQDYQIERDGMMISPAEVCFTIPFEAAWDNKFQKTVASFLVAKDSKESGNDGPMALWFMSERAYFYEQSVSRASTSIPESEYDPDLSIDNEDHRGMNIDSQKHENQDIVGTFWYEVYAAAKNGDSFQLERGFVDNSGGGDAWLKLRKIQEKWKIENFYVTIDGKKWPGEIAVKVASFYKIIRGIQYGRQVDYPSTWTILTGDKAKNFPWMYSGGQKVYRVWSPPRPEIVNMTDPKGKPLRVPVFFTRWSNLAVKDQLASLLIGGQGKPKFHILPRNKISAEAQSKESGMLTWDMQMQSEFRDTSGVIPIWEKLHSSRPNHGWDISCMRLVRLAQRGLAGHQMAPE